MSIVDDLQLGLKNCVMGVHGDKLKSQKQKVKATLQNS
jgi:hypothetical protein